MTYSRVDTHDPSGDLDDPEGNDTDSRTPLDRTIDQIGMGPRFFYRIEVERLLTWLSLSP